ncbi:MAG: YlxR family protein [Chloroflexota bacterium]
MSTHRVPERTCIVCGERFPKRELTRVVAGPDGTVRPDPTGKAPGRGAYVCGKPSCRERLAAGERLARSLRAPVSAEAREGLAQRLSGEDAPGA